MNAAAGECVGQDPAIAKVVVGAGPGLTSAGPVGLVGGSGGLGEGAGFAMVEGLGCAASVVCAEEVEAAVVVAGGVPLAFQVADDVQPQMGGNSSSSHWHGAGPRDGSQTSCGADGEVESAWAAHVGTHDDNGGHQDGHGFHRWLAVWTSSWPHRRR